jgi:subtilisin family serine protease
MPSVYIIHAEEDRSIIRKQVLPHLAMSGFDHWLSRHHLGGDAGDAVAEGRVSNAMAGCQGIVAVATTALPDSEETAREVDIALDMPRRPVVVVQLGGSSGTERARLPERFWSMPTVDLTYDPPTDPGLLVGALLPPVDLSTPETTWPQDAESIPWDAGVFSKSLVRATERHDHALAETLVATLERHLRSEEAEYPSQAAYDDLQSLRRERAFQLMRRYAEAVMGSGTSDAGVRRLFAQALIEKREFDRALDVLESILQDPATSLTEVFEAHGLIGRTFKQRYVERPDGPQSAEFLQRAIESYRAVYEEDRGQFWHGVNAASCMLRAERDGVPYERPGLARQIAAQVEEDISLLADKGPLEIWDCASRVEALIALDRFEEAERAVEEYIRHPDMTAFEVSSTFRQCEQVLELGHGQQGASILDELRRAMERYRSSNMLERPAASQDQQAAESVEASDQRSLLIRLGDDWNPIEVRDLAEETRLGKVVTARGSADSVRELLADPRVISVEESRPAGNIECERSVPFIGVAAEYSAATGPYVETGENALIAIIDNGIDVLQEAFVDGNGNSRIVGIWDQSGSGGSPPAPFSYGVYHDAAAVAGYVKTGSVPPSLGRNIDGHGTHVTSIAAGRRTNSFAGGVAPDARILVVISSESESIGYSQSHVDALVFINAIATQLGLPVVVNVSQGMNAGAHDGKSALEVAFDAFSESGRKPGRVVVKSAGNERGKGGHAKLTIPTDSLDELRWERAKEADYSERIELWWSSRDELTFRLRDPNGEWTPWVGRTLPTHPRTPNSGGPIRISFTKRHVDNGDSQLLIELGEVTAPAASGEWLLQAQSQVAPDDGIVHCWIERGRGKPTKFLDHQDEEMTLSIPGTASSVIAVGAIDASKPIQMGSFSSYGPTRDGQRKPLVCAPGVNVNAARGGVADGALPLSGTSMAAPHVAGAIALVLSRAATSPSIPNSNQIAAALRRQSWDRGQGYGVIEVAGLLGAFD